MSEHSTDEGSGELPLRYRAVYTLSRVIDRYLQWRKTTCPICDEKMSKIIPAGYMCMNPSCKAYKKDLATARLMSRD
jgi:hypothetical protein